MNLNEGVEVWLRSFLISALCADELSALRRPLLYSRGKRVIQVPYDTSAIGSVQGYEPHKLRIAKFEAYSQQDAYMFTFRQEISMFVDVCVVYRVLICRQLELRISKNEKLHVRLVFISSDSLLQSSLCSSLDGFPLTDHVIWKGRVICIMCSYSTVYSTAFNRVYGLLTTIWAF